MNTRNGLEGQFVPLPRRRRAGGRERAVREHEIDDHGFVPRVAGRAWPGTSCGLALATWLLAMIIPAVGLATPPTEPYRGAWQKDDTALLIAADRFELFANHEYRPVDSGPLFIVDGKVTAKLHGGQGLTAKLRLENENTLVVEAVDSGEGRRFTRVAARRATDREKELQGRWVAYGGNGLVFKDDRVIVVSSSEEGGIFNFKLYGSLLFLFRDGTPVKVTELRFRGKALIFPDWDLEFRRSFKDFDQ